MERRPCAAEGLRVKRRRVDRRRQALMKAAELDDTGFDWTGTNLDDPQVQMAAQQDHSKGIRHPGLGCCE